MSYLLSIVIPTKNRQTYCFEAVRQILDLNRKDIQIVLQDNSDTDSLKEAVMELNSTDIKYHYHGGILSFVDNFSEAVSLADGKYICMIGDDDGVLPHIVEVAKTAEKEGYDAVVPGLNAVYCWPSENSFVKRGEKGYLCLSYLENRKKDIDCMNGLFQLVKQGGQGYQQADVPRLYHGLVRRDCMDQIRIKTGKYFDGLTPDIYIATALCFVCKKVCRIGYPITISGICPSSGSADSATGRHTGRLKDAPHFRGHETYQWDKKAPAIYSVESIWAESVLKALKNFQANSYYDAFRVDVLDGICLQKYPQFSKEIKKHAKRYQSSLLSMQFICYFNRFKRFAFKCRKRITRSKQDVLKYFEVPDISAACKITMEELRKRQLCV